MAEWGEEKTPNQGFHHQFWHRSWSWINGALFWDIWGRNRRMSHPGHLAKNTDGTTSNRGSWQHGIFQMEKKRRMMDNVVYLVFIDCQGSHCFVLHSFTTHFPCKVWPWSVLDNASEITLVGFFQDLVLHRFGGAGTRLVWEPGKNPRPDRRLQRSSHMFWQRDWNLEDVGENRIFKPKRFGNWNGKKNLEFHSKRLARNVCTSIGLRGGLWVDWGFCEC